MSTPHNTPEEREQKSWEECCNEIAKKRGYKSYADLYWRAIFNDMEKEFYQEASELFTQEKTDEINKLIEENERLKKENSDLYVSLNETLKSRELAIDLSKETLKQSIEYKEALFEMFNILRSADTFINQILPTKDSYYKPDTWLKKVESLIERAKQH